MTEAEADSHNQLRTTHADDGDLNRLIVESAVDSAIVTIDGEGTVTSWSEGAERILGWKEEEIVGRSASVFFTEEDIEADRVAEEMRIALETGRAEDVRWHVRKDGERFWANGMMLPLNAADGGRARPAPASGRPTFLKIFRDRTQEHLTDRRIAELESRVALALRGSKSLGVWDYDILGDIVTSDERCAELYGVEPTAAQRGVPTADFYAGIHPDDVSKVREALERSIEMGTDFELEYRVASGGTKRGRWVQVRGELQRDTEGRAARLPGIVSDVTAEREEAAMQRALLALGDRLRDLHDEDAIARLASEILVETLGLTRAGHGRLDPDGDTVDIRADATTGGATSIVGMQRYSTFGAFSDDVKQGKTVVIDDADADPRVADPEPLRAIDATALVNIPLMVRGHLKAVLFLNDLAPRAWTEAEIAFARAVFDRTHAAMDRVRYEAERDLIAAELAHRVKNLLSVAQSVIQQSLSFSNNIDEAKSVIGARLAALGTAQDVLLRTNETGADLATLIEDALAGLVPDQSRMTIRGPRVSLRSDQVLGFSLALHELATNAGKYGALSKESGAIDIRWSVHGDAFRFSWAERDGPPVSAPAREGFGSFVLNRAVGGYFRGKSNIEYGSNGVTFSIEGSLD